MPLAQLTVAAALNDEQQDALAREVSAALAVCTGKPEAYVMVLVTAGAHGTMGGRSGACAFADVRGIGGFNREVNVDIARRLGDILSRLAGIDPANLYLTYTDVPAGDWGWKGGTFG